MNNSLKNIVSNIPYPIGRILTRIPYKYRLGKDYSNFKNLIEMTLSWSEDEKSSFVIDKLNSIKGHAQRNFPFYTELYSRYGVIDLTIKDLSDWRKLPLIDKEQLRPKLASFSGHYKINTGGTSGEPFAFFVDKNAWAREWAHMHYIWSLKGYEYTMPKITIRGKNLGTKLFQFNPVHNEFIINTYKSFTDRSNAIEFMNLVLKKKIKYIHGYPSAIFIFLTEIEKALHQSEIEKIKMFLKVCFLGSEYPVQYMTDYLKNMWNLDYVSWYGHSEMCILAFDEHKENDYKPFLTYGYAEMHNSELIGTSFNNTDMPLVRYKTGDLITGSEINGMLSNFSIKEGRQGDFIFDREGKAISLTGLIFGRHHKAFDIFDFVQVRQNTKGRATILVTNKFGAKATDLEHYFELSNVDIDFTFEEIKEPVLSKAGKFKLKV